METKEKIILLADDLFMRFGIRSVSMDDIARELGISKKTLYQYFTNKADLIAQAIQQHIEMDEAVCAEIVQPAKNAIDELVEIGRYVKGNLKKLNPSAVYDLKKYYKNLWELLEEHRKRHIYGIIKANIKKGQDQGLFRKDVLSDVVAKLYISKLYIIFDKAVFPNENHTAAAVYAELLKYHIHGIASEKGVQHLKKILQHVQDN